MNNKIKGIIIGGVVVGCLGATLAFLELTGKPADDNSSSSEPVAAESLLNDEPSIPLMAEEKEGISKISFSNEYGELNIVREKGASAEETDWSIEELDGINQNNTAIRACVNICSSLSAKQVVEENASDLAKYGLSSPSATVTVTSDVTGETSFLIGDEIPTGDYRYIAVKGSNTVYTALINNINYFLQDKTYFCSLSLVYTPSDDAWPNIDRLTVKRKDLDYEMVFITLDPDEVPVGFISSQAMIKPVFSALNITTSADVTHGIWGLTAVSAEVVHPTEEDFAKYGLDDPQCTVILDCDTEDYTLKVGNTVYATDENGNDTSEIAGYYCYINAVGTDCIYLISADECVWATVLPGDIIGGQMASNYIMDLDGMTVETQDKTYDIDINAVEEDKEAGIEEVFDISIDSLPVSGDLFKNWYTFWLECPTNETYFEPLTGDEVLYCTVTISRKDGTEQVVKFYRSSGRRLIAEIDGNVGYKIPISYAETLISNIENVKNGKAIVETY